MLMEMVQCKATHIIDMQKLEKKLAVGRPLRVKYGIDPTNPHVHLGHTVPLRLLREFQLAGHKAILIIGDFTASIGDPTGRDTMRPLITVDQAVENSKSYLKQISKVIDIDTTEVHYNSSWFSHWTFTQAMERMSLFTIQQILARDDFKKRLIENKPVHLQELMYPLLQGEDSVRIHADVELGGTEQLFALNIGRQMQIAAGQDPQVCITLPILIGLDGIQKMGKSLNNFIAVDEEPFEMYSKIMSIPDSLMPQWFDLLTEHPMQPYGIGSLHELITDETNYGPMERKKELAHDIVQFFCGSEASFAASEEWVRQFTLRELPIKIQEYVTGKRELSLITLLYYTKLVDSKSEGRRMVEQGAVKINGNKILDPCEIVPLQDGLVLQVGRRKFVKIKMMEEQK